MGELKFTDPEARQSHDSDSDGDDDDDDEEVHIAVVPWLIHRSHTLVAPRSQPGLSQENDWPEHPHAQNDNDLCEMSNVPLLSKSPCDVPFCHKVCVTSCTNLIPSLAEHLSPS